MSGRCVAALVVLCAFLLMDLASGANAAAGEPVQAHGYKMAGDAARMRGVIRFDREPEVRWSLLRGPHRLMLDLPDTSVEFDHAELSARGMVTDVQYGHLEDDKSRVIISFDGPFQVERVDILENDEGDGSRLVADIVATSESAFEKAMVEQIEVTASTTTTPKVDRIAHAAGERPVRIVIDPGHGGIDTGAEGPNGTLEKTITLAFSLELKKKLQDTGLYDVFMTRDRDEFLRLDERVKIARQHEADLLISVHADSIRLKNVRGATVYTVSDKASDAEAAAKAIRENLADAIGGIVVEEEDQGVADILADLIRRETQTFSIRFARSLVGELS